jgi:Protein of unknown function (DUF4232)
MTSKLIMLGVTVAVAVAAGEAADASGRPPAKPAAANCQLRQLRITTTLASPGASHHGYVLLFHNRGGACTMSGYPGVDALAATGRRLESATRTKSGYLGGLGPGQEIPVVRLAHNKTASALTEYIDGPVPGLFCPKASAFKITPPNTIRSVKLRPRDLASDRICRLQVHPVVPGVSGQGT